MKDRKKIKELNGLADRASDSLNPIQASSVQSGPEAQGLSRAAIVGRMFTVEIWSCRSDGAHALAPDEDGDTAVIVPDAPVRRDVALTRLRNRRDVLLQDDVEVAGTLQVERSANFLRRSSICRAILSGSAASRSALR